MKVNIKKWGTLAFLILGFQWVTATSINDCYIDIFKKELTDLQSEETIKYFETNYESGYDAWEVLYRADPLEDRMNLSYIDELSTYLTTTGRTVDELVNEVTIAGSYNTWAASVIPKKLLSTKDTSKKLDILNRQLIARSCDNCLPLAEIDIVNDAFLISNITQWLPSNLTTAKKIGDLEQVKYSDDGVAKVEDLAIYEDPNNLGKLYLSNGREQILEKLFLNEDFKKIYDDMVNFVSQPRMFPDELTLSEEAIYRFYSNETAYSKFNTSLINKETTEVITAIKNLFNNTLDKLPSSPGVFYRGIGAEELELFLEKNIGETITYKNLVVTNRKEILGWTFLKNNLKKTGKGAILQIISKNGKDITKYTDLIEDEILHKSNSAFVIEEIKHFDEQTIYDNEVVKDFYKILIREEGAEGIYIPMKGEVVLTQSQQLLSIIDTSKKLDVLNNYLISNSCVNCEPIAVFDIINEELFIRNISQWLPSNLTTAKKIGDLKQVKYSDNGETKVEDIAIYEDPDNLGKLYLSNGREQILEKLFLNKDFKAIYDDMASLVSRPQMFADELTLLEEAAYRFYTNNTYYKFNQDLINGAKVDGVPETESLLNSSLDKSPSYPGVLYRGIGKEEIDLFLKMNIGESITYKNFFSTSKVEKLAWIFLKNNKLKTGQGAFVKIISKNGRDISKYSDAVEYEVLHKSNSVFVLEEIKYINEETIYTGEVIKNFYKIVLKEEGIDAVPIKSGISDTTIPREIEYEFEKLGFYYKLEPSSNGDGTTKILHYLKKEDEEYKLFGNSNITADGIMDENTLIIPKVIEGLGVLDAVYKKLLTGDNGIKKIESEYVNETDFADEYNTFMSVYSTDKNNLTEAALATSEGKILGNDWQPTDITFNNFGITLTWVKKNNNTTDE